MDEVDACCVCNVGELRQVLCEGVKGEKQTTAAYYIRYQHIDGRVEGWKGGRRDAPNLPIFQSSSLLLRVDCHFTRRPTCPPSMRFGWQPARQRLQRLLGNWGFPVYRCGWLAKTDMLRLSSDRRNLIRQRARD